MKILKCKFCKKEFIRNKSDITRGRTKYCSMECYFKNKTLKSKKRIERTLRLQSKQCQLCNVTKSLKDFHTSKTTKDGYSTYCRKCKYQLNIRSDNKRLSEDRTKFLEQRKNWNLKKTFGITIKDYYVMFNKQDKVCAICHQSKVKKMLSVDHCHKTNKIRGLLCDKCNYMIGLANDDINILKSAIKYLE